MVAAQARLSVRRTVGFIVTLTSALLLPSVLPIVIPLGALYSWLAIWLTSIGIFIGCFLMFELEFKKYVKSLLAGVFAVLIINIIFLPPLSFELQLILATLFLLIVLFFSRYYLRRSLIGNKGAPSTMRSHPFLKKAAGCTLIAASGLLFYLIFPIALSFGLFIASLTLLPILSVGVIGYSLISRLSFREFLIWLVSALVVILLAWIVILPADVQILSGAVLALGLSIVVLYGYYQIRKRAR